MSVATRSRHRGQRTFVQAMAGLLGAAYYPLPSRVGRFDPRHAAFLTIVASA